MPDQDAILAHVVEGLPDPVIVLDSRATILLANDAARRSWPGLKAGLPLSFTLRAPAVVGAVETVLAGAGPIESRWDERVPVAREFALRASGIPAKSAGDPRVILAFRDLTEERRLERLRADFVANASHELRTPLASLLGFVETLQGPARDDPRARDRFLGIMKVQAERMTRLINDLLSLSRVEMSEHRTPEDGVDLASITAEITEILRPMASDRGVAITFAAEPDEILVQGDRDELARVAENLIENAVKYGRDGGKVDVFVSIADRHGVLTVRDFGPGIAPQHLPRLTERFYRVDDHDSREKGGTGLGLAIVKHIVNRHRGRLSIESPPGQGATFRVTLPLAPADD